MAAVKNFTSIVLLVLFTFSCSAAGWQAHFADTALRIQMDRIEQVELIINAGDITNMKQSFHLQPIKTHLAHIVHNDVIYVTDIDPVTRIWRGNISIYGNFLGQTNITINLFDPVTNTSVPSTNQLSLTILRPQRIIDHAFVGSVVLLISLLYINFGAALDIKILHGIIVRPVGPIIGFLTQSIIMPLLSYGLGLVIFPDSPELQLGLFFTGVSPSGGASNTWSVVLNGNINLSVLMTTISNLSAFFMMPMWIFTLGKLIFKRGNMVVPYAKIGTLAISLVVPLAIGLGIQRCSARVTRILVRLLKPISMCLILFIVIFAIVTNYYLFELFSWQIVMAGLALPWLGYSLAWLVAKIMLQNSADALTIAIETGIQNTGISIFLLTVGGLPQPQADLTTVVPVSVAIMTPLPLLCIYAYQHCMHKTDDRHTQQSLIDK